MALSREVDRKENVPNGMFIYIFFFLMGNGYMEIYPLECPLEKCRWNFICYKEVAKCCFFSYEISETEKAFELNPGLIAKLDDQLTEELELTRWGRY